METSDLSKRMKSYEDVNKTYMIPNLPLLIRVDGNAFHTFAKKFEKPYDHILNLTMRNTMFEMCKVIPGCVFGYTQSDEITFVLVDYNNINAEPWFGGVKRKIESITAAMATKYFNKQFFDSVNQFLNFYDRIPEQKNRYMKYCNKIGEAMFDSRAFNLPIHEVTNNLIWRQLDAIRNSVQMYGHAYFSQKELQNKNCSQIKEMLLSEKNINWDELPTPQKRGICCIKEPKIFNPGSENEFTRNKWILDMDIPVFTENRDYIERFIKLDGRTN